MGVGFLWAALGGGADAADLSPRKVSKAMLQGRLYFSDGDREKGYACEQHESAPMPGLLVGDATSPGCRIRALLTNEERFKDVMG